MKDSRKHAHCRNKSRRRNSRLNDSSRSTPPARRSNVSSFHMHSWTLASNSRKEASAVGEYNRFSKGIFGWIGYRKKWLEYENIERAAGETKWSFWSLMLYAIQGIIAFSTAPLVLSSVLGLLCCVLALVMIVVIIIRTLAFGDPTAGWPSLVCIILLLSGIQMLGIGILGQYLAKTYLETKRRPIYLVAQTNIETRK